MEKKTVWYAQYFEIDKLINDNFPQVKGKYECLAYEEYGNDEVHTFNVNTENKVRNEYTELEEGKFHYKLEEAAEEIKQLRKTVATVTNTLGI